MITYGCSGQNPKLDPSWVYPQFSWDDRPMISGYVKHSLPLVQMTGHHKLHDRKRPVGNTHRSLLEMISNMMPSVRKLNTPYLQP